MMNNKMFYEEIFELLHLFKIERELGGQIKKVVVITEDVPNVHLLLEYRPHIDVSLTCEHDPKLQEYCSLIFIYCSNVQRSLPLKETLRGHSDSSFRGEGYIQCCIGVRLCDMYSNQELAEIHFMYGKADGNAALARRLYQERYPQRQCPDRKTFVRLHYRLCDYGKFNSPGLGRGRPRSTTPEVQEEILEAVNMTPSVSTRRVALQVNVPHTTVWRLLKRVSIVSLSFATCTGPVTSRSPCTSSVLSVVLAAVWCKSELSCLSIIYR
ncbi:hypothetical protein ANN_05707 [Periplaneta americana]|uniref:DUF4817 domain-containing protein n=1 Tax=Periplaneta americana TaxID=6978 RepID=A0ABQ8TBK2_PERAM|nr:hypothetical protein ANN_05707 [Periplaneta americana]